MIVFFSVLISESWVIGIGTFFFFASHAKYLVWLDFCCSEMSSFSIGHCSSQHLSLYLSSSSSKWSSAIPVIERKTVAIINVYNNRNLKCSFLFISLISMLGCQWVLDVCMLIIFEKKIRRIREQISKYSFRNQICLPFFKCEGNFFIFFSFSHSLETTGHWNQVFTDNIINTILIIIFLITIVCRDVRTPKMRILFHRNIIREIIFFLNDCTVGMFWPNKLFFWIELMYLIQILFLCEKSVATEISIKLCLRICIVFILRRRKKYGNINHLFVLNHQPS